MPNGKILLPYMIKLRFKGLTRLEVILELLDIEAKHDKQMEALRADHALQLAEQQEQVDALSEMVTKRKAARRTK